MKFRVFQIYEIEAQTRWEAFRAFEKLTTEQRKTQLVDQFAANPKPQGWLPALRRQLGW